jgi:O-antigen ligase
MRLRGPGIFNDPNDFCLLLVPGMVLWMWQFAWRRRILLTAVAIGVFSTALFLTGSRGGFIVLLASVAAYMYARLGWKKMLPLAAVVLPVMFLMFAGRSTSIDLSDREDTAQQRIQLWSDGLMLFRESPVFGIGEGNYADRVGLEAHNSFVHCFTELGFFGGTSFLGAFYLALIGLQRCRADDDPLIQLRPFLMAMIAGYVAGILALSRSYVVPTYLMLALAVVYHRLAGFEQPLTRRLIARLFLNGVAFLIVIYVFVRATVRWN